MGVQIPPFERTILSGERYLHGKWLAERASTITAECEFWRNARPSALQETMLNSDKIWCTLTVSVYELFYFFLNVHFLFVWFLVLHEDLDTHKLTINHCFTAVCLSGCLSVKRKTQTVMGGFSWNLGTLDKLWTTEELTKFWTVRVSASAAR